MGISGVSGSSEYRPTPPEQDHPIRELVSGYLSDPSENNSTKLQDALNKLIDNPNTPPDQKHTATEMLAEIKGIQELTQEIQRVEEALRQHPDQREQLVKMLTQLKSGLQSIQQDMQQLADNLKNY